MRSCFRVTVRGGSKSGAGVHVVFMLRFIAGCINTVRNFQIGSLQDSNGIDYVQGSGIEAQGIHG